MLQSYLDVIKHLTLGYLFTENLYRPTLDDGEFNQNSLLRRGLRGACYADGDRKAAAGACSSRGERAHWVGPYQSQAANTGTAMLRRPRSYTLS